MYLSRKGLAFAITTSDKDSVRLGISTLVVQQDFPLATQNAKRATRHRHIDFFVFRLPQDSGHPRARGGRVPDEEVAKGVHTQGPTGLTSGPAEVSSNTTAKFGYENPKLLFILQIASLSDNRFGVR